MSLVFTSDSGRALGNEVATSVVCLDPRQAFCSGEVTPARDGRRTSAPVSVRGSSRESVFVPFRLGGTTTGPKRGFATTTQPRGAPTTSEAWIYADADRSR